MGVTIGPQLKLWRMCFFLYNWMSFMKKILLVLNWIFSHVTILHTCEVKYRKCWLKILEIIRAERWGWPEMIPGLGHPASACLWRKWMLVLIALGLNGDDGVYSAHTAHSAEPTPPFLLAPHVSQLFLVMKTWDVWTGGDRASFFYHLISEVQCPGDHTLKEVRKFSYFKNDFI